ncbi:MAG: hypothetical protein ACRCT8_01100 [Lacipirellulaceae bacterium]
MHDDETLPKSQRHRRRSADAPLVESVTEQARIDPPHGVRPATAKAPATAPQPIAPLHRGANGAAELRERVIDLPSVPPLALAHAPPVQGHAQQLAEWLQQQLAELADRERAVVTQEEDLAQKLDAAKAWLDEQRRSVESRQSALEARETLLDRPAADPRLTEQLAGERAEQLAERHRELDARQAQLDEGSLGLVAERARLAGRQDHLDAQAAALAERARQVEATAALLADERREARRTAAEAEARATEALAQVEAARDAAVELDGRERRLEARGVEIQTALQRYERLGITEQRLAELEERLADAAARGRNLADAEGLVAQDRAALAARREHFERHLAEGQATLEAERRAFESGSASRVAEAKRQGDDQRRREEELDRREESLKRLQAELQVTQREVLDMRLATEETWAQLTGALAPAALSRSIARVRGQLADYYATSLKEMAEGRGALRDAATQVSQEFRRLAERRAALEEWANRRHEELGAAAQRLECREHELDRQQRSYEELEAQWAAERNDLREQLRTLLRELRTEPLRVAA